MQDNKNRLTAEEIAYLKFTVEKNYDHARHIESERLTVFSIYFTAFTGFFALGSKLASYMLPSLIILFLFGMTVFILSIKWKKSFNAHWSEIESAAAQLRDNLDTAGVSPCPGYRTDSRRKFVGKLFSTGNLFINIVGLSLIALVVFIIVFAV